MYQNRTEPTGEAPGDEGAAKPGEGEMDIGAAFEADDQPAELGEPRQGPLHHLAVPVPPRAGPATPAGGAGRYAAPAAGLAAAGES